MPIILNKVLSCCYSTVCPPLSCYATVPLIALTDRLFLVSLNNCQALDFLTVYLLVSLVCLTKVGQLRPNFHARHFGTGAELSGHFGTSLMVPKCLGSEVSWVRSVLTPYKLLFYNWKTIWNVWVGNKPIKSITSFHHHTLFWITGNRHITQNSVNSQKCKTKSGASQRHRYENNIQYSTLILRCANPWTWS